MKYRNVCLTSEMLRFLLQLSLVHCRGLPSLTNMLQRRLWRGMSLFVQPGKLSMETYPWKLLYGSMRPAWMITRISAEMDGHHLVVLVYKDTHSFEGRGSQYCLPSLWMGSLLDIFKGSVTKERFIHFI